MSQPRRYRLTNSNIIHDTIEGEVILLNLETGTYYQLTDNGVPVWNALIQGTPVSEVEAGFRARYPTEGVAIEQGIAGFVHDLALEGLVMPLADDAPASPRPFMVDPSPGANGSFVAPRLLKYTDMQSLLLLDPVHDVDAHGWPLKPDEVHADA